MLFRSLVQAALVATALAQPVQHQHHQHEKKDVVTRTVVVTVGTTVNAGDSTETAEAVVASVVTSAVDEIDASTSKSSTSETSTSSASTSTSTFSALAKGITYSPYTDDGGCKSQSTVTSEIEALSGYEIIRLYGVDCNQVEYVLGAMSSDQKLFAGIYFMDAITEGVATLAAAVEAANGWDQVHTVSIGNELVNSGQASSSKVATYVEEGRTALEAAGYTGYVVSVDTFIAIYDNTDLCDVSDYVAANAHAYFDGGYAAADAGTWVSLQYEGLQNTCPGKDVLITETGWPSQGTTYGLAVAGTTEQSAAIADISDKMGSYAILFNAYDDAWKPADTDCACEQYWGIL